MKTIFKTLVMCFFIGFVSCETETMNEEENITENIVFADQKASQVHHPANVIAYLESDDFNALKNRYPDVSEVVNLDSYELINTPNGETIVFTEYGEREKLLSKVMVLKNEAGEFGTLVNRFEYDLNDKPTIMHVGSSRLGDVGAYDIQIKGNKYRLVRRPGWVDDYIECMLEVYDQTIECGWTCMILGNIIVSIGSPLCLIW